MDADCGFVAPGATPLPEAVGPILYMLQNIGWVTE